MYGVQFVIGLTPLYVGRVAARGQLVLVQRRIQGFSRGKRSVDCRANEGMESMGNRVPPLPNNFAFFARNCAFWCIFMTFFF